MSAAASGRGTPSRNGGGSGGAACTAQEARTRLGTALALLEVAAQALELLPPPEAALEAGDRELFRYLQAAETALGWVVGQGEGDCLDAPGPESALGDGQRIFDWTDEESLRHFQAALEDLGEAG